MSIRTIALLALAACTAPAIAQQSQRLEFRSGGTMSATLILTLDLDSGVFTLTEGPIIPDRTKADIARSGTIDTAKLADLKARIRTALAADPESKDCKIYRRRETRRAKRLGMIYVDLPHLPDYLASLSATLDGRVLTAPLDPGCWSDPVQAVVDTAVKSARASVSQ